MTNLHRETESGFTTAVIECAQMHGFLVHHDRPARIKGHDGEDTWRTAIQGDKGFPDILAIGHGRLVVAELKVGRNATSAAQDAWLWQFGKLASLAWHVECHLWRPENWDEIEETFKRRGAK